MSAAVVTFGSFLQANAPSRTRVRRRMAVLMSIIAHGAVLAGATVLRSPRAYSPPPPEPIRLRLAPPRVAPASRKAPPESSPPRPARRPPPPRLVQPPEAPPPEPVIPPPEPEVPVEELAVEASEADQAPSNPEPQAADAPGGRSGGLPGASGDAILELRDVARAPAVLEQVKPDYPRQARWEGLEGMVVLRVVIGLDGRVERGRTQVVRSVRALDAAAIAAIEQWRFSPAIGHGGQRVRVVVEIPIRFTLR